MSIAGSFAGNSPVPFYLAMVFAFLGGMLFSLIHALLCIRFKANQVISGVVHRLDLKLLGGYMGYFVAGYYLKAFDWQKYVTEYNVRFGNNVGYAFLKYLADYPGTKGNDSIHGDSRNNIIYGDEGNDTLYGYYGHDTLYGGDGNDSLRGAWGNDVLYAGRGNDTLDGYQDDDTYIINPAEINGTSYTKIEESKGNDTVIFQGVNSDEITAQSNNQGTIYILFTNYPDNKIEIPYQKRYGKKN